ncbi:MAG TPA: hypothetical protein VHG30_00615 [Microvirga sp.]|nr:hypothetical protein [Microvirga sp.]
MRTGSTAGTVRHLHLARTARLAGEAFAFADPDARAAPTRRLPLGGIAWVFLAVAGVAGLYLGF